VPRIWLCIPLAMAVFATVAATSPASANMLQRLRGSWFGYHDPVDCAGAYYHGNESRLAANGLVWACTMTMSETIGAKQKEIARCYFSVLPGTKTDDVAEAKMEACKAA
jgi:hypothetical protein